MTHARLERIFDGQLRPASSDAPLLTSADSPWGGFLFQIDMERCPNCASGALKIIAAITEQREVEKILTHLGLEARAPPRTGVREAQMFDA